jgi:virginiamycin B lyase
MLRGSQRPERRIVGTLTVLAVLLGGCSTDETERSSGALVPSPSATSSAATPTTAAGVTPTATGSAGLAFTVQTFPVPAGSHAHDVAPAPDGGVWYTAQASGKLGWLDPVSGAVREVPLGKGSAPHGVIVGPDGAPWITDAGLNAIVRVDPASGQVTDFPLPPGSPNVSLNTADFDGDGVLWFTGQAGYHGRLDPASGEVRIFGSPRGGGPYGIAASPSGDVYYASLAASYLGAVDPATGEATVLEPPTPNAGPRRCWSDSLGRIWVSEWNVGQVAVYDPADGSWREWKLPGAKPRAYAVFVDDRDIVWLTDFGANAIVRFDPVSETFTSFPHESQSAEVRQLNGRPGEVWGAESAADRLVVIRTGPDG